MIAAAQRHTRGNPCPICGGQCGDPRGRGVRDWAFDGDDGRYAFCSRVESPHFSPGAQAWRHLLRGDCDCGQVHGYAPTPTPLRPKARPTDEPTPLDGDTLDRFFRRLLALCPLWDEHRERIAARGAGDLEAAERFGYGSLPRQGAPARTVLAQLVAEFGRETVRRAPGFWRRRNGAIGMHTARDGYSAALIPGFDDRGRLHCLVRWTMEDGTGEHAKYENFSRSHDVYTVAGAFGRARRKEARLTEGLHKAHVAAVLDADVAYVGLSGTNLHGSALEAIRRLSPDVVIECLDADKAENPNVAQAARTLRGTLRAGGFTVETASWRPEDGKGIDDLLAGAGVITFRPMEDEGGHLGIPRGRGAGPDDDAGEWCAGCAERDRLLTVRDETIARLQREAAQQATYRAWQWRAIGNETLRPSERLAILSALHCAAEAQSHGDESSPLKPTPLVRIAAQAGVSATTAGRAVHKFDREFGLLRIEKRKGEGPAYQFHNRRTGRVETRYADLVCISLNYPLLETYQRVASIVFDRPAHGGARQRVFCPDDASHPVEKRITTEYFCSVDGHQFDSDPVRRYLSNPSAEQDAPFWKRIDLDEAPSIEQDGSLTTGGEGTESVAPSSEQLASRWERAVGYRLARYDRLQPEVLALSGRALWRREQLEDWLESKDGGDPEQLAALDAQLDWYSQHVPPGATVPLLEEPP